MSIPRVSNHIINTLQYYVVYEYICHLVMLCVLQKGQLMLTLATPAIDVGTIPTWSCLRLCRLRAGSAPKIKARESTLLTRTLQLTVTESPTGDTKWLTCQCHIHVVVRCYG